MINRIIAAVAIGAFASGCGPNPEPVETTSVYSNSSAARGLDLVLRYHSGEKSTHILIGERALDNGQEGSFTWTVRGTDYGTAGAYGIRRGGGEVPQEHLDLLDKSVLDKIIDEVLETPADTTWESPAIVF